jgi:ATP-dependent Clp protease, protease subunit
MNKNQLTSNFVRWKQFDNKVNIEQKVMYLTDEITEYEFDDITMQYEIIKKYESEMSEEWKKKNFTLIINSPGGDVYTMFALIDWMNYIRDFHNEKVDVIVFGKAMSAAAVIMACATGTRKATKHCSIMFHEMSSWEIGKSSDLKNKLEHVEELEEMGNEMVAEHSNKDVKWWNKNQSKDMFLTPVKAKDLGVIDEII